jgi:hypothetical protein
VLLSFERSDSRMQLEQPGVDEVQPSLEGR